MIANKSITYKVVVFYSVMVMMIISCSKKITAVTEADPWKRMESIIKSIPETHFSDKTYNINDFGAVADAKTSNTLAFEKAIKAC
ncbi:MAG: glycoside hydrolase family 28 protein, partial [Flavobacterium sp.]